MTGYKDSCDQAVSLEQLVTDLASELGYKLDLIYHPLDYYTKPYTEYRGWKKIEEEDK